MTKFDQFILKRFVAPFFGILVVVLFILMLQMLWVYIDELVGKGLGLGVVLEFMGWGGCTLLPLAMPLAVLLSSVMTLGSMAENSELIALKSAGVSLARIMTPLLIVSFVISIGAFFVSNNLVPIAWDKIYTLRDDILHTKNEIKIPTRSFYDGIDGYVLRVEERNEETGMMYDVMVYDHTNHKKNTNLTVADSASMTISKNKTYILFTMYNGVNYDEVNRYTFRDTTRNLSRSSFDVQTVTIPLVGYAFHHSETGRFSDEVNSLSLGQLYKDQDSLLIVQSTTIASQLENLSSSRTFSFMRQLDSSVYRHRSSVYENERMLKFRSTQEEIDRVKAAQNKVNDYISTLTMFGRESYRHNWYIRNVGVGILKKYANALSCFVFFFIGAPLGALIMKKQGLGTPMIIAVLFFVLYWVVDISGTKLAKDGAASVFNGVFISAYVLWPLGILLSWGAMNDSKVFNLDIKGFFRRAKIAVLSVFHKTRIVYMGTPEFAVAPLDKLIATGHKVVGVVTAVSKPVGRGMKMSESAVAAYAREHGIPCLQPEKLKDPEFIAQLKALKPDLIVVVAFRMLPKVVWEIPSLGTFNLHAALLPQYRGAAPINWAVINGENMTGVTSFMIDEGIDTGKIMQREQYRIKPEDTAGDVHDALMALGSDVVVQTVDNIIEKHVELRLQKTYIQGSEVLRPAPKISKELCHIDWRDSSVRVQNLIRGLSPYPGAYTELVPVTTAEDGAAQTSEPVQLKIFKSHIMEDSSVKAKPGTILSDGKTYLAVATLDGAVCIDELQLAGKKRMSATAFLLGFRNPCEFMTTVGTSADIIKANQGV